MSVAGTLNPIFRPYRYSRYAGRTYRVVYNAVKTPRSLSPKSRSSVRTACARGSANGHTLVQGLSCLVLCMFCKSIYNKIYSNNRYYNDDKYITFTAIYKNNIYITNYTYIYFLYTIIYLFPLLFVIYHINI